ncbi:MAG: metallophosphoesterase [Lachnospiraceae bacterium]|nr:metallophosphoesterase [Lachnospiraceae bacterium]
MKVIVIPDIHLKPWIFDRADEIMKKEMADRAVCLMDIADDWGMELHIKRYEESYDRAIAFAKAHPNTLWCYGNHDVSYVWGKLETGYSAYAEATVRSKLKELEKTLPGPAQIAFVHRIEKVIFSHGGITTDFVRWIDGSQSIDLMECGIEDVITAINAVSVEYLWNDISPLWTRPQYGSLEIFRNDEFMQVVGHTPVERVFEKDGVISTDVFSTYRDGRQIGESCMIVIDTETGDYEKHMVNGAP